MGSDSTCRAPVLPKAKMNLVPASRPVTGRVVSNDLCLKGKSASFVRHTEIDVTGTPLEGGMLAGQSFGVIPAGVDDRGRPHKVRLYSLACPGYGEDGAGRVISTTPKRLIDEFRPQNGDSKLYRHRLFLGVCSNYLCDLHPGDEVKLTGPNGKRFVLPVNRDHHDYLFVATGTGIAPFRGMALELLEHPHGPCSSQVHLVTGAPYATDLLYDELFVRLAREHENFHYHTAISRETAGGRPGRYVHHLLEEHIETFAPLLENSRTLLYICGLIGMQLGLYQILARHRLGGSYFEVRGPLTDIEPARWELEQLRRGIRPTQRCMIEVY